MTLPEYYDSCFALLSSVLSSLSPSSVFRAVLEDGTILEWEPPQSWHNVFSNFKFQCQYSDCCGVLFCGSVPVRFSGPYLKPFVNLF